MEPVYFDCGETVSSERRTSGFSGPAAPAAEPARSPHSETELWRIHSTVPQDDRGDGRAMVGGCLRPARHRPCLRGPAGCESLPDRPSRWLLADRPWGPRLGSISPRTAGAGIRRGSEYPRRGPLVRGATRTTPVTRGRPGSGQSGRHRRRNHPGAGSGPGRHVNDPRRHSESSRPGGESARSQPGEAGEKRHRTVDPLSRNWSSKRLCSCSRKSFPQSPARPCSGIRQFHPKGRTLEEAKVAARSLRDTASVRGSPSFRRVCQCLFGDDDSSCWRSPRSRWLRVLRRALTDHGVGDRAAFRRFMP